MDAAMVLNVLAGYDRLDIASVEHAAEDYVTAMKQAGRRPADRHRARAVLRSAGRRRGQGDR